MKLVRALNNEAFCDSVMVSKKFGQKHSELTKTIRKLKAQVEELRGGATPPKVQEFQQMYRGQEFTAYLMDRTFFSLLAMRFRGLKALEWQIKFNDAFYEMELKLLNLQNSKKQQQLLARKDGILVRKEETNAIAEFIDYAVSQGSRSAKWYYSHITKATYKALELVLTEAPSLRDTLGVYELSELLLAERLVICKLYEYMSLGRNYKDIFQSIKKDLIHFGTSIRVGIIEDRYIPPTQLK